MWNPELEALPVARSSSAICAERRTPLAVTQRPTKFIVLTGETGVRLSPTNPGLTRARSPGEVIGMDWRPLLHDLQLASADARAGKKDLRQRLARARQLIDASFDQPLDLDQIARAACLSPHHFHRLFRRELGATPHQYLTRRRLDRARRLLLTTERSITEICLDIGFQSLGSFSALFRRYAGHSPARYRALVVQSLGVPRPAPRLAPIPGCFLRAFAGVGS